MTKQPQDYKKLMDSNETRCKHCGLPLYKFKEGDRLFYYHSHKQNTTSHLPQPLTITDILKSFKQSYDSNTNPSTC